MGLFCIVAYFRRSVPLWGGVQSLGSGGIAAKIYVSNIPGPLPEGRGPAGGESGCRRRGGLQEERGAEHN